MVVHLRGDKVRHRETGEVWNLRGLPDDDEKRNLRDVLEDWKDACEGRVGPYWEWSGWRWRAHDECARGVQPDVVTWEPLADLDGFAFFGGHVQLTDERTVRSMPNWVRYELRLMRAHSMQPYVHSVREPMKNCTEGVQAFRVAHRQERLRVGRPRPVREGEALRAGHGVEWARPVVRGARGARGGARRGPRAQPVAPLPRRFTRASFGVYQGAQRGDFVYWPVSLDVANAPVFTASILNTRHKDIVRVVTRHVVAEHHGRPSRDCVTPMLKLRGDDSEELDTVRVGGNQHDVVDVLLASVWFRNITDTPEQHKATGRTAVNASTTNQPLHDGPPPGVPQPPRPGHEERLAPLALLRGQRQARAAQVASPNAQHVRVQDARR